MTYAWRILLVLVFCLAAALPSRAGIVMGGGCPSKQEVQRSCAVEPASAALPAQSKADAKCGVAVLPGAGTARAMSADAAWLRSGRGILPEGQPADRDDPPPRTRHS